MIPIHTETNIVVYAMPGSQFSAKVIAALQSRNLPHYIEFVPTDPDKRAAMMPSGGRMVPEIVASGPDSTQKEIVSDSEAILHWLDDTYHTNFFPTKAISDLSLRASSKVLAGSVFYYNWVHSESYERSMQKSLAKLMLPSWLPSFLAAPVLDMFVKEEREKYRHLAADHLGLEVLVLENESHVRKMLLEELAYMQSKLCDDSGDFMYGSVHSTAADFSIYAQLERLVGEGTASDVQVYPALQSLKRDGNGLDRLWQWHNTMREKFPVKFKGKRIPKQPK